MMPHTHPADSRSTGVNVEEENEERTTRRITKEIRLERSGKWFQWGKKSGEIKNEKRDELDR